MRDTYMLAAIRYSFRWNIPVLSIHNYVREKPVRLALTGILLPFGYNLALSDLLLTDRIFLTLSITSYIVHIYMNHVIDLPVFAGPKDFPGPTETRKGRRKKQEGDKIRQHFRKHDNQNADADKKEGEHDQHFGGIRRHGRKRGRTISIIAVVQK